MDSLVIGALVGLSIATCKLLRTPDASDKHVIINMLLLLLIALIFLRPTIWTILTASLFYRLGLDSPNIMLKIRDKLRDILMKISEKLKKCVSEAWIPQQNKSMDSPDWPISPIQRPVQSNKITVRADYLNISCPNDLNKDTSHVNCPASGNGEPSVKKLREGCQSGTLRRKRTNPQAE